MDTSVRERILRPEIGCLGASYSHSTHFTMKRFSTLLLLSLLAISCQKSSDTADPQTGNFSINGVRDVDLTLTSTGSYTFPVSVVSNSGAKDTVDLTTDLIPGGVYADFKPNHGITPFTSLVTISTDYSTGGGTFPFKIKGIGRCGTRTYDIRVTLDAFRGWQLGSEVYQRESVDKDAGGGSTYPTITVHGPNSAQLRLSFPAHTGLPITNSTYTVSSDTGAKKIQIAMYDGAQIWSATGRRTDGSSESATGVFTFDTLKRFTFKAFNVEVSDGLIKKTLNCSFSE